MRRCAEERIAVEAYSPLTKGRRLEDSTVVTIAGEVGRTPAQVLIRWSLPEGVRCPPALVERPSHRRERRRLRLRSRRRPDRKARRARRGPDDRMGSVRGSLSRSDPRSSEAQGADPRALSRRARRDGRTRNARRLERGREWDLAPTLAAGGVVVFPHAGVLDCGHQVAAAVHGCLDSGADRVLVISVLHAFTDEMERARMRVSAGEDPSEWPFWGIQGTGIEGETSGATTTR